MTTQEIISKNISSLRKMNKMTQSELADKLNYTEQAISKWERGLSLPDAVMLLTIANLFNVSIEYMYQDHVYDELSTDEEKKLKKKEIRIKTMLIVSNLTVIFALTIMIMSNYFDTMGIDKAKLSLFFIPVVTTIVTIINYFFGRKKFTYILLSVTSWSLANSFYIYYQETIQHIALVFGIALAVQILIIGLPIIDKYYKELRKKSK